jgi:hypothetical protein
MQEEQLSLDDNKRNQLDSNIKKMLAGGASNDDVISYASDFKNKFGLKKKGQPVVSSTPTSKQSELGGMTDLSGIVKPKLEKPSVLTPKGEESYVKPIKPSFDITLGIQKLKSANKEASQLYYEDPTIATKREKDELLKQANDGITTASESLQNSLNNFLPSVKAIVPQVNLLKSEYFEKAFPKSIGNYLASLPMITYSPETGFAMTSGQTVEEVQQQSLESLTQLQGQFKETLGLIDSFKNPEGGNLVSALAGTVINMASTAIPAAITGGISIPFQVIGQSLYDYNDTKAKSKGITVEDLYKRKEDDTAVPVFIGSLSTALEYIGLKGMQKAIMSKLTGSLLKKSTLFGLETNKEGVTEWLQTGLDKANTTIAKGGTAEQATKAAVDSMFSEEGLESYLQGVSGSTGGAIIGRLVLPKNIEEVANIINKSNELLKDLKSGQLDAKSKEIVVNELVKNKNQQDAILNNERSAIDELPKESQDLLAKQVVELNEKKAILQNENISESLKETISKQVENLETKIQDAIQIETAGQVPVQPEARVGEEVEQGKPQPEVEGVTEEGVKAEEVTPALKDVESTANALEEVPIKNEKEIGKINALNIIDKAKRISEKNEYLNCDAFCTRLVNNKDFKSKFKEVPYDVDYENLDLNDLSDLENTLKEGDIIAFGDKGRVVHYATYIGDGKVIEVEEWGSKPREYSLKKNLYTYTSIAHIYRDKSKSTSKELSEAYHKSKADSSNPELVKAVEDLLAPKVETITQAPPQQTVEQLREQEQAEYAAMDNPKDKAERQKIYDKLITPLIRAEAKQATTEVIDVHHGGNVKSISVASKNNPLFVSENKEQAKEYTKENKGKVSSFKINNNAIATEEKIYEIINRLGLESKEEGWDVNDLNVFELIDKYFSSSLSDSDIQKVFKELEKEGYGGVRFYDTNLKTLKQDIQNIVIFNPELVKEAPSQKQATTEVSTKELTDAQNKLKRAKSEASKNRLIQDVQKLSTPEQFKQFIQDNPEVAKNLPKQEETVSAPPISEELEVEGEVETPSEAKRKDIEKRRQELLRKLRVKGAQAMSGFNLDMIPDLIKLGATYVEDGIVNFKDFAERLKQDLGYDVPEDNARDIFKQSAKSLGKGIRKLPTRIAADEGLSPKLRTIAEKIDAVYQKQNYEDIQASLDEMSKDDKISIVAKLENVTDELNKEGNVGVLAAIDLLNKYEAEGDLDGAERVFNIISKSSTVFAQLLRQYGQLKSSTVKGFLSLIEKDMLKKYGVQITDAQKADITKLYEDIKIKTESAKQALENHTKDLTNKTQKDLGKADIELENSVRLFNDYLDKLKPKTFKGLIDKMIAVTQGNLLTLKSLIVNITANIVQYGNKFSSNEVANLLDLVISTLKSTPRTRISGFNPDVMRLSGKAAFSGLKAANRSLLRGATAKEISKYDVSGRLKPVEAWKSLWQTLSGKKQITAPGVLTDLLEGIPGATANLALRLLPYGDLPRNQMAKTYKLVEIGITKFNLKGKDLDRFILNPDKESLAIAEDYGDRSTLQNKTLFYNLINKGIASFDTPSDSKATAGLKSLGKFITRGLVVPFLKTPINAAVMAFRLSNPIVPLGQAGIEFGKILEYRKEKNVDIKNKKISESQHKITGYLGEAIVAQVVLMSAVMLVKYGLTSGGVPDKDKKERDFMFQTFGPNQINISGLKRLLSGGDPTFKQGDVAISYMPLGLLGAQLGVVTEGYKQREKEGEKQSKVKTAEGKPFYSTAWDANEELGNAVTENLPASAKYMLDQGFVQGTSAILDAVSKNDYDRWSSQWVKTFTTGLAIPNTVVQTLKASNEYMTNTFDDDQVKNIANTVKNLYGDTEDLPVRYDMFGKKILQTPKGENPYVYHIIDIFRSQQLLQDKDTYRVFLLYKKTGDRSVIPSSVSDIVEESRSEFKIKLTPQQTADLQRIVGEERLKRIKKRAPFNINNNKPDYLEQEVAGYKIAYENGLAAGKRRFKTEVLDKVKK